MNGYKIINLLLLGLVQDDTKLNKYALPIKYRL